MNKEYIERDAAVAFLENMAASRYLIQCFENKERFPAADVAPVVHGEWIKGEENSHRRIIECSHCKTGWVLDNSETNPNYCPNCGARMDGGN